MFLAIGSNIDPRKDHIHSSFEKIQQRFPLEFSTSDLYLTEPYMEKDQASYYNCCVRFICDLSMLDLLDFILETEKEIGRKRRGRKWESRVIDLDIVFFGDKTIQLPNLTIPHYDVSNRDFFLIPLLELDESLKNPKTGLLLKDELANIPEEMRTHPVRLFDKKDSKRIKSE